MAEQVFQHRLQSTDVGLEEKFGEAVQRAYQRWLKFLPFQDDVLRELKQKREQKQWENKFRFSIFFATKVLFPLSGGKCLINSDHKPALKKIGNMERYLYYCHTNLAGRDWEWVRKILLL